MRFDIVQRVHLIDTGKPILTEVMDIVVVRAYGIRAVIPGNDGFMLLSFHPYDMVFPISAPARQVYKNTVEVISLGDGE